MLAVILIIILLIAIVLLTIYIRRNPYDAIPVKNVAGNCKDDCTTCLDVCASSKTLAMQLFKPKNFDDDELDGFAGMAASDYDDKQTDVFRSIFESLSPGEVAEWTESLRRRGIELPAMLKDEIIMIMTDSRNE